MKCWNCIGKILNKCFGKPKLSSMSVVEFSSNRNVIKASTQFIVEVVVVQENWKRFILACSSLLLKQSVIEAIWLKGESKACQELIQSGFMILGVSEEVSHSFFSCFTSRVKIWCALRFSLKCNSHWSVYKDSTASSMSGLCYGYYWAQPYKIFFHQLNALYIN